MARTASRYFDTFVEATDGFERFVSRSFVREQALREFATFVRTLTDDADTARVSIVEMVGSDEAGEIASVQIRDFDWDAIGRAEAQLEADLEAELEAEAEAEAELVADEDAEAAEALETAGGDSDAALESLDADEAEASEADEAEAEAAQA